jgi:hypothetical protein
MTNESAGAETPKAAGAAEAEKASREQSTIGFPYGDLDDAVSVADALLKNGGVPCEADQLASALGQVPSSGSFRMKVATARMFGLIQTVQGKYELTPLGFAINDASRQKAAKADAFLQVPLYRKVYDTFRNQQLPPRPAALQRTFVQFGVASKQADKARMAFDRSAQQAGYFEQAGRDRLVRPVAAGPLGAPAAADPAGDPDPGQGHRENGGSGGGAGRGGGGRSTGAVGEYHPFVLGLLDTLPNPGTVWAIEGRAAWLEAAASAFKLIYKGDGRIKIAAEQGGSQDKGGVFG